MGSNQSNHSLAELNKNDEDYQFVSKQMKSTLKKHNNGIKLGSYTILKIQKVENSKLWKQYTKRQNEIKKYFWFSWFVGHKYLFHGTPNAHNIIENGFDTTRASPYGMFGRGIYFAEHSSKSNQYAFGLNRGCTKHSNIACTTCTRQMLLCRVTLGKTKVVTGSDRSGNVIYQGYHAIQAVPTTDGLRYPEYVIYNNYQAFPEYLIEYTINENPEIPWKTILGFITFLTLITMSYFIYKWYERMSKLRDVRLAEERFECLDTFFTWDI